MSNQVKIPIPNRMTDIFTENPDNEDKLFRLENALDAAIKNTLGIAPTEISGPESTGSVEVAEGERAGAIDNYKNGFKNPTSDEASRGRAANALWRAEAWGKRGTKISGADLAKKHIALAKERGLNTFHTGEEAFAQLNEVGALDILKQV